MRRLNQVGDQGELWSLRQPTKLIGGDDDIGAWGLVDFATTHIHEVNIKIATESLLVSLISGLVGASISFASRKGSLIVSASFPICITSEACLSFLLGLIVPRRAIDAHHE
jgi:hypothetical protein